MNESSGGSNFELLGPPSIIDAGVGKKLLRTYYIFCGVKQYTLSDFKNKNLTTLVTYFW